MFTWLNQLNDFSFNVLLLVAVIIIKILIARIVVSEPLAFFAWYCQKLADKVNKKENNISQQKISGTIATLITLVPMVIILWLFADFITVTWLWQSLLLYFALGDFQLNRKVKDIVQALNTKQNHLAKQQLKPLVLREVESLSTMGLAKTTIEMQLLRYLQSYFIIASYFLVFGSLSAFFVRLVLIMHYSWNVKQLEFQYFGRFTALIFTLIQWLPIRVFSLLMLISSLGSQFISLVKLYKQHCFKLNNDIVIALLAKMLAVKLAGVAIYNQQKVRRTSFNNSAPQPNIDDIIRANKIIHQLFYFSLALTILVTILTLLIH
ncbi:MAG: cobalamin biosynthesis protein CbiB [Gammaproteobacteria bacterium]|nr:MAG: cobalamin biosynthesis protein CbiB [Gammaproteobacteria bacterium]